MQSIGSDPTKTEAQYVPQHAGAEGLNHNHTEGYEPTHLKVSEADVTPAFDQANCRVDPKTGQLEVVDETGEAQFLDPGSLIYRSQADQNGEARTSFVGYVDADGYRAVWKGESMPEVVLDRLERISEINNIRHIQTELAETAIPPRAKVLQGEARAADATAVLDLSELRRRLSEDDTQHIPRHGHAA